MLGAPVVFGLERRNQHWTSPSAEGFGHVMATAEAQRFHQFGITERVD
jgi:hypothetical protein